MHILSMLDDKYKQNIFIPFCIAWDKSSECAEYKSVSGTQTAHIRQRRQHGRM